MRRGSGILALALAAGVMLGGLAAADGARAQEADETAGEGDAAAASMAKMMAKLNLTARQEAAMLAYYALVTDPAAQPHPDFDAYRAMTLPQQLDYIAAQMASDVTRLKERGAAARRFYDLLSADQRKAFDAVNSPPQPKLTPQAAAMDTAEDMSRKLPSHSEPSWRIRPSADDMARVYPRAARARKIAGRAMLHCVVDTAGLLSDCTVGDETPKDSGFGNAALEITAYMRMNPATNLGVPVESRVNVPISFEVEPS